MRPRPRHGLLAVSAACLLTSACTMGLHGSFSAHSWVGPDAAASAQLIGEVEGRSCQTRVLYAFGRGEPATTDEAINDAKSKYPGTLFLADISIDDEVKWHFLYSVQCIVVRAEAYR